MTSFPEYVSSASRILISLLIVIVLFREALFSSPLVVHFLAQLTSPHSSRMRFTTFTSLLAGAAFVNASPLIEKIDNGAPFEVAYEDCSVTIPKVFIISMFEPEANIWYTNANTKGSIGNLLAKNITVPGFSPVFPDAHCLADGSVCQLTTGESEINAASTISALMLSPLFNLSKTYFLIAGIAGINPKHGTLADVAFSKYAVQVALQYEFDGREIPSNFSTGYVPQGAYSPSEYPSSIYGTEVFEVNEALRDIAVEFASSANLSDSSEAVAYRTHYVTPTTGVTYHAAARAPCIISCDVATSDVYFSGTLLGEAFENTTSLFTNGSGVYCMTAQEDNATLEALLRAASHGKVDFGRIIIMRTASDFDRPYPGLSDLDNLFYAEQGGFEPALQNIYLAGTPVVKGILEGWRDRFEGGVEAGNYLGDIFGTLGGMPDFGPGREIAIAVKRGEIEVEEREVVGRAKFYRKSVVGRADGKGKLGAQMARRAQGGS